jgi:hypothetical protein
MTRVHGAHQSFKSCLYLYFLPFPGFRDRLGVARSRFVRRRSMLLILHSPLGAKFSRLL